MNLRRLRLHMASETSPRAPGRTFRLRAAAWAGPAKRDSLSNTVAVSAVCRHSANTQPWVRAKAQRTKTRRSPGDAGTADVKIGMAKMLKGGVIMDVVDAEQARIVRYPCRLHFKSERCAKRAPKSAARTRLLCCPHGAAPPPARAESDSGNAATRCRAVDERSPPSVRAVPKHKRPRTTPKNQHSWTARPTARATTSKTHAFINTGRGRRRRRRHGARQLASPPTSAPAAASAHVRPADDRGHQEGRDHPRHGQGAHRPLRRGPGPRSRRGRLH